MDTIVLVASGLQMSIPFRDRTGWGRWHSITLRQSDTLGPLQPNRTAGMNLSVCPRHTTARN